MLSQCPYFLRFCNLSGGDGSRTHVQNHIHCSSTIIVNPLTFPPSTED